MPWQEPWMTEVIRDLEGSIVQAAKCLAEHGYTADEAGEFISDSVSMASNDWARFFDEASES